jgi:hypothetical protein
MPVQSLDRNIGALLCISKHFPTLQAIIYNNVIFPCSITISFVLFNKLRNIIQWLKLLTRQTLLLNRGFPP